MPYYQYIAMSQFNTRRYSATIQIWFLCPIYVIYTSVYYSIAHSSYAVERTMYNYPYIFRSRTDRINVYGSNNIIREKRKSNAGISCFAHIDTRIHFVKGLISLLSGVLIALFSGMEHSYIHLAVGIMLGSALFTLVGISLSAFISTMNNFMLIMVPTLIISVAPISVYTMGYKSGVMLLHPSISLIELMSGNISVISLMAISIWCIAMYIFSCLSVKKMMTI